MVSVFSRRIIAYVLDFFVVSAFMWIISYLVFFVTGPNNVDSIYAIFPYLAPILGYIYFVFFEKTKGATVGKALLYLEVRSRNGARISWAQSIVRNLTKIFWIPIIFDWLFGKVLNTDRILNNITRTTVVDDI